MIADYHIQEKKMKLYHASDSVIEEPDIHYGRKNADFGWGFYLTPDKEFACRWAGEKAVLNEYELDTDGLLLHRFLRDADWFQYIYHNRKAQDSLNADIIIGPTANDILFDTLGILSSGILPPETALQLLLVGPEYTQVTVKTEKALQQLHWLKASEISGIDPEAFRAEEEEYLKQLAEKMEELTGSC